MKAHNTETPQADPLEALLKAAEIKEAEIKAHRAEYPLTEKEAFPPKPDDSQFECIGCGS